jgi:hypothetical protein
MRTPQARRIRATDRAVLSGFRCSGGAWYEDEIETYVRTRLFDAHNEREPHNHHQVILLEDSAAGMVGVGAHEEEDARVGANELTTSYLALVAVRSDYQGTVVVDGGQLDDDRPSPTLGRYLMEVLLSDLLSYDRQPYVRAVVARENERSLRLCDRVGLAVETPFDDARYVQRFGRVGA